ncbi:hypothetical protein VPH35_117296 [Triticum aestivum]
MAWGPWPVAAGSHGCAWRRRSRTPDPGSPRRPLGPRGAVHHAQAGGRLSADGVPLPPVPERGCNEEEATRVLEGVAAEGRPWTVALVPHRWTERFDCVTGDSLRCVSASAAVLPLWPISLIEGRVRDNVLK